MVKLKAKRILVVEDEQVISNLCLRVLGKEGFEVDIASDGEEAQGKIEASQYDLLFIDLRLPKVNGEELYA